MTDPKRRMDDSETIPTPADETRAKAFCEEFAYSYIEDLPYLLAEVRAEERARHESLLKDVYAAVETERANAAALRNVLEDCHAHDLYVSDGAEASAAYRRAHGQDFGRTKDQSATDHARSVRAKCSLSYGQRVPSCRPVETVPKSFYVNWSRISTRPNGTTPWISIANGSIHLR